MKRIFPLLICTLVLMTSCHKSGIKLFSGDYSFKTSGEVYIVAEAEVQGDDIIIPGALVVSLINEMGQLNISVSDKDNDEVIVVINHLNGDVVTTTGTCNGNTIELDEFQRYTLPVSVSTWTGMNATITVRGTGHIYEDDMIVFDMSYTGKGTLGDVTYVIKDKDVRMVAYRN
ncbi:MAG: hypothetical protein K5920_10655 [Bacteroidales bacterium]|nr:hypothetical protein [Bacteroidales bacterium]